MVKIEKQTALYFAKSISGFRRKKYDESWQDVPLYSDLRSHVQYFYCGPWQLSVGTVYKTKFFFISLFLSILNTDLVYCPFLWYYNFVIVTFSLYYTYYIFYDPIMQ